MKKDRDKEIFYRTSAFSLASFLHAKGLPLLNINSSFDYQGRKEFVFRNTLELERLVKAYRLAQKDDRGVLIDARSYEESRKKLLSLIYD